MKNSKQFSRVAGLTFLGIALAVLTACSNTSDLPQQTEDGLELVENTRVDAAYRDPDADFSRYHQVYIADVKVSFRKNWLRDQNVDRRSVTHRLTEEDARLIKDAVAREFHRIFTEELEEANYKVVAPEASGSDDILALVPTIANLDVTAPDTMAPGRTHTYTTSAASMTLYMELYDSVTGAVLGRVADSQSARDTGHMSIANSVTNKAEAERMLRKWARQLVAKLDEVHGK